MSDNTFYCSFVSIHYIICECGETFASEEVLKEHLEKDPHHKIEIKNEPQSPTTIRQYKCGTCNQIYETEFECLAHQETAHITPSEEAILQTIPAEMEKKPMLIRVQSRPVKLETVEEKEKQKKKASAQNKNVVCETCGKKYASNAALNYHQRVHTGVRPYHCSYCPKTFTMPLFQQVHQRIHTGERPYLCPQCPKAFTNKAALLRHDRVHTGEKPYSCPHCHKSFSQSNSMKLHVHTVHLKLPTPYKSKKRRAKQRDGEDDTRIKLMTELPEDLIGEITVKTEPEDVFYCDLRDNGDDIAYEIIYENSIE